MKRAWILLGAVVAVQMAYPLAGGAAGTTVTAAAVLLGAALAVTHALSTRVIRPRAPTAGPPADHVAGGEEDPTCGKLDG